MYFEMLPEQFVVNRIVFDDGGADYALQTGGVGLRTWIIKYDGLFPAEAAILDAWVASMFYSEEEGSAFGANLRHHIAGEAWTSTNGTLYSNVHIKSFKTSHSHAAILVREFVLEQRP